MINLELPDKFSFVVEQAREVADEVLRPISRHYDREEHTEPKELEMLQAAIEGMEEAGQLGGAGASGVRRDAPAEDDGGNRNGSNMASCLGVMELCRGDVGLLLSMPRQGLGNAAIAAVADEDQAERFDGQWAAMAITEPEAGSDSAAITTTAERDGDEYVLNGEKIFVTAGKRADLLVVWATLDPDQGRAAIKSFVVDRDNPGLELVGVEDKLGIRASDTAHFVLDDCRVPADNLLGSPEIDTEGGFAGAMETFDNTRPMVAAMAVGLSRACLEETERLLGEAGITVDHDRPPAVQPGAAGTLLELQAELEAARLLTLQAAWMADNAEPNSLQASMAKAKAGRTCVQVAMECVALCGSLGYGERELLEKWARDAKILDIFEGTQQIQQLIIARRLLGLSSSELR